MARAIPTWPCRPGWPHDGPYIWDGEFYYDKRGGKPCKTMEEAYRERYKVLIHNNAMPPSPRYGTKTGTVIAVAFLVITVMVLVLNIMWSCGGCQ